jgi:hypothetical protein
MERNLRNSIGSPPRPTRFWVKMAGPPSPQRTHSAIVASTGESSSRSMELATMSKARLPFFSALRERGRSMCTSGRPATGRIRMRSPEISLTPGTTIT